MRTSADFVVELRHTTSADEDTANLELVDVEYGLGGQLGRGAAVDVGFGDSWVQVLELVAIVGKGGDLEPLGFAPRRAEV